MPCHLNNENIISAAQWLADRNSNDFSSIIPVLKERFGLTASEGAQACSLANKFRNCRRAFG